MEKIIKLFAGLSFFSAFVFADGNQLAELPHLHKNPKLYVAYNFEAPSTMKYYAAPAPGMGLIEPVSDVVYISRTKDVFLKLAFDYMVPLHFPSVTDARVFYDNLVDGKVVDLFRCGKVERTFYENTITDVRIEEKISRTCTETVNSLGYFCEPEDKVRILDKMPFEKGKYASMQIATTSFQTLEVENQTCHDSSLPGRNLGGRFQ